MNIIALDVATKTGFAMSKNGLISTGIFDLTPFKDDYAFMGLHLRNLVITACKQNEFDVVYIERPFFRGGSSYLTGGLVFAAHMASRSCGVRRVEVAPDQWRKAILGPGKRTSAQWKMESLANAWHHLGRGDLTYDEADAFGLLQYAIQQEGMNADA